MKAAKQLIKIISTFLYTGYIPLIPGSSASLLAAVYLYLIKGNAFLHFFSIIIFLALGFFLTGKAEEIFGEKDCGFIVIDEITGMLLSYVFLPHDIKLIILAFILFRILDIIKPFPARRFQEFKGSLGIMADDIIAGIYTNIILQVALRLASFKIS